jgi:uncharacterized protein YndB with AHSA1/START domain
MYCIKLQLLIDATKEDVFKKLTSVQGLRNWWTIQTSGDAELNGIIDFRFGDRYHIQMKVIKIERNKLVQWQCTNADEDWIGTIVSFDLDVENGKTLLRFTHDKWPTHGDFFAHCNLSWAKYLLSLRLFLETGKGQPFQP